MNIKDNKYPQNFNSLYDQVVELLQQSRKRVVNSVNHTMVQTYYQIGKKIVIEEQNGNERAEYGKAILQGLSEKLTKQFGKGFTKRNLELMRQFYLIYSKSKVELIIDNEKTKSVISQSANSENSLFLLSWTHYIKLMRITNEQERIFYEIEAVNNNWSIRELNRQFNTSLFERLTLSRDKKGILELSKKGQVVESPEDTMKDPLVLEFLGLKEHERYSETDLEQRIIDRLEEFLLELGKGFAFISRQKRITIDDSHFYIDLVFYNRLLKCFVIVDLKIGELKHQDLGQIQMYVNYYDRFEKLPEENPTIGIIICKDKKDALVEITMPKENKQIFASKYELIIPSKETLKQLIELKI